MSVDSSGARLSSEQRSQCDDVFPDGLPGETSHSHGNEQDINVMSETDETDELLNTQALLHTGWGELLKTNTREPSSIRRHAQSGFEQAARFQPTKLRLEMAPVFHRGKRILITSRILWPQSLRLRGSIVFARTTLVHISGRTQP